MGCMMGFAIDTPASRMNKGDSGDTASAKGTSRAGPQVCTSRSFSSLALDVTPGNDGAMALAEKDPSSL